MNGFWYEALDGFKLGDIIYVQDSHADRRKSPFLITAVSDETFIVKSKIFGHPQIYRHYYIVQPKRRRSDK